MKNGKVMLLDSHTVAIEAPDGSQTLISFGRTSQAVDLYLKLVNASIDHMSAKETDCA